MGKRERPASEKKAKKRMKKEEASANEDKEPTNASPKKSKKTKSSIFLKKKVDIEVSLLPGSLHNSKAAVEDSISQLLMKYSDGLGGILLSFENVRLGANQKGQGQGWILNELPWIHYTSSCDALVFRPHVGCELHGVVNECFPSHIGLLVLDYFNAMVSADELREAGYTYDADLQKWVQEGGTQVISADSKIAFEVDKMHECEGTVSLEGVKPSVSLLVET